MNVVQLEAQEYQETVVLWVKVVAVAQLVPLVILA